MFLYHTLQPVVRCLIRIYTGRVEGWIRYGGGDCLVGNHLSLLDPLYRGLSPKIVSWRKESFRHPVAVVSEPFHFPVDRGKADLKS